MHASVDNVDSLPAGVRPLADLASSRIDNEEAVELRALAAEGLPLAEGWLVTLSPAVEPAVLASLVREGLSSGRAVRLRPLFPSRAVAARVERRLGLAPDVYRPEDAESASTSLLSALDARDVRSALGALSSRMLLRVAVTDADRYGRAASADPLSGDPDELRVWQSVAAPWRVDRRSARVIAQGEGSIDGRLASAVADLADRAQLVLGRPVELEWLAMGDQVRILSVRPIDLVPAFTNATFRLVALVAQDEGAVVPMSVDALDRALRTGEEPPDEPRVQRIYARPYRRMDEALGGVRTRSDPTPLNRVGMRVARVLADLAAPLRAVRQFDRELASRLQERDRVRLDELDDVSLVVELRDRQRDVAASLRLLDRTRRATKTTLAALEGAVGALPREAFVALAHPRPTKARRRVHERLSRMARQVVEDDASTSDATLPRPLSAPLRRKWYELRHALQDTRPLGLDMGPPAFGEGDAALRAALAADYAEQDAAAERARRDVAAKVLSSARARPLGRAREALATSLVVALDRVARAKGAAAEALAAVALRQRQAALEAGARLTGAGLIDAAEDALYMYVAEIDQALNGEPGAYAARVRLRRENDDRWARFQAPRRIDRRRRTSPPASPSL